MKEIIVKLISFTILFTLYFALFILIFRVIYDETTDIIFFAGVRTLIITSLLLLISAKYIYKFFKFSVYEYVLSLITSASLTFTFFVLFPVTTQRSLTIFMLRYVDQQPAYKYCQFGFSEKDIEELLIEKYIRHNNAAAKRLYEQLHTGYLRQISDSCFTLSSKGKIFLKTINIIDQLFKVRPFYFDRKLLYNKNTE